MDPLLQGIALAVIGALLAIVLKGHAREMALVLTLGCCCLIASLAIEFLAPVVDLIQELQSLSGLDSGLVAILLRTAGIGLLAETACAVCSDAGESALGKMAQFCGGAAALYVSLPLISTVLSMVQALLRR